MSRTKAANDAFECTFTVFKINSSKIERHLSLHTMPLTWTSCEILDLEDNKEVEEIDNPWHAWCLCCGTSQLVQNSKTYEYAVLLELIEDAIAKQKARVSKFGPTGIMGAVPLTFVNLLRNLGSHNNAHLVSLCLPCHQWLQKNMHKNYYVLPYQTLQWHIRTIEPLPDRRFIDVRVLYRLCCTLAQPSCNGQPNPYLLCFYPEERELMVKIAADPMSEFKAHVARFYFAQNMECSFMATNKIAEYMRFHLGHWRESGVGGVL